MCVGISPASGGKAPRRKKQGAGDTLNSTLGQQHNKPVGKQNYEKHSGGVGGGQTAPLAISARGEDGVILFS